MHKTRRIIATAVATAALVAPSAATTFAVAADAPAHSTKADKAKKAKKEKAAKVSKPQTKQLLKDVSGKDKRLARLATSGSVVNLADDVEAELVANIDEARTALADVRTAVEAADSTLDTRAARKDLRSFRVENFRLVVNILKQAEGLAADAAADPEATAHLVAAEDAALAITATSTKADVKAARAHLQAAHAELEPTEDEVEPVPAV